MNPYRAYFPRDDAPTSDGNAGIGLMAGLSAVGAHQAVRMGTEIVQQSNDSKQ